MTAEDAAGNVSARLERGHRDGRRRDRADARRAALAAARRGQHGQRSPGRPRPTTSASSATTSTAARRRGFTPERREPDRAADGHDATPTPARARHVLLQGHRRGRRRQRRPRLEHGERDRRGHDRSERPAGLTATGGAGQAALDAGRRRPTTSASSRYNVHRSTTTGFTPSDGEPDRAADRHELHGHRARRRHLLLQGHRRGRRRQRQRRRPHEATATVDRAAAVGPRRRVRLRRGQRHDRRPTSPGTATPARSRTPRGPARPRASSATRSRSTARTPRSPSPTRARLDLTTGMTLEAWVRPTTLGRAGARSIVKERPGDLVVRALRRTPTSRPAAVAGHGRRRPRLVAAPPRSPPAPGRTSRRRTTARRCGSTSTARRSRTLAVSGRDPHLDRRAAGSAATRSGASGSAA